VLRSFRGGRKGRTVPLARVRSFSVTTPSLGTDGLDSVNHVNVFVQAVYNRREEFFLFGSVMEATMIDKR
jgi:hypothetical protein